eukprot:scaffold393_cov554-Prasinococcus_capsulatus_cf.AAC.2
MGRHASQPPHPSPSSSAASRRARAPRPHVPWHYHAARPAGRDPRGAAGTWRTGLALGSHRAAGLAQPKKAVTGPVAMALSSVGRTCGGPIRRSTGRSRWRLLSPCLHPSGCRKGCVRYRLSQRSWAEGACFLLRGERRAHALAFCQQVVRTA